MIKQNNILLYLFLSLLFTACKKDELPNVPEENIPVFTVEGSIGDEKIYMYAGENDVFMQTNIDSFNNVKLSTGQIGNDKQSLSISVFNSNVDKPALADNFMEVSSFPIANESEEISLLSITQEDFENHQYIQEIEWTVDGESQQSGSKVQIESPGKYTICAEVEFITGSSETTCNTIIVGYKRHADFQLKWNTIENNIIDCFIASTEQTVSEVKWYVNDTFKEEGLEYQYDGTENTFHLKAEISFENGAQYTREVYIDRFDDVLSVGDWASTEQTTSFKWDSNISLTFEKNGVTYKSIQNAVNDAQFTVDKMTDYSNNNTNHEVKKIKGSLLVPFKNMTTGEVVDSDLKMEIGVGY